MPLDEDMGLYNGGYGNAVAGSLSGGFGYDNPIGLSGWGDPFSGAMGALSSGGMPDYGGYNSVDNMGGGIGGGMPDFGGYGPVDSGLRGITDPMGGPANQPAAYGDAYQTAQMMRGAYPNIAANYDQTRLANALETFSRAMPGEAAVNIFGNGAMPNIGRVGINQIIGGMSPERMLANMDTTGLRSATRGLENPGPNSMGMVAPGSPQARLGAIALKDALMGRGVTPEAMNASNFVAAGSPMVPGVNPVGDPVRGTQFGSDPNWGNRIAMANKNAMPGLMAGLMGNLPGAAPNETTVYKTSDTAVAGPGYVPPAVMAQPIPEPVGAWPPSSGWNNTAPLGRPPGNFAGPGSPMPPPTPVGGDEPLSAGAPPAPVQNFKTDRQRLDELFGPMPDVPPAPLPLSKEATDAQRNSLIPFGYTNPPVYTPAGPKDQSRLDMTQVEPKWEDYFKPGPVTTTPDQMPPGGKYQDRMPQGKPKPTVIPREGHGFASRETPKAAGALEGGFTLASMLGGSGNDSLWENDYKDDDNDGIINKYDLTDNKKEPKPEPDDGEDEGDGDGGGKPRKKLTPAQRRRRMIAKFPFPRLLTTPYVKLY